MKKSAATIVATMLLTAAGCASNEPGPALNQYERGYQTGARAKYYEEIRAPASVGLRPGVECDVR